MKKTILLTTILMCALSISSFGKIEFEVLTPKKMQKDLNVLLETIEAHPDPFTKISKSEFQLKVKKVRENISKEMDEIDFYKNLAELIASLRDGHSRVYMPQSWMKDIRKENGAFPYDVFLTNENQLFIVKSYGDKQIALGAQILAINDMPIDKFISEVSTYISYETIPFRNDNISNSFEFLLYLVFKKADQLSFKYKHLKESEVRVKTMPHKQWASQKKDLREERERLIALGRPYDFNILQDGIAKIDIFSFDVPSIEKYNIFLSDTFKEIKKNNIHSLIIDVRGNYGGWPKIASELFHHIHEDHFKTMARSSMKVSQPYRSSFVERNPNLASPYAVFSERRHYLDLKQVMRAKLNTYVDEDIFFNEAPVTEFYEFSGDCYVLIDRKSYSASSSFASTFQCYSMGLLIGEPTGGTKIFRANAFNKMLPKTGLSVNMSTTKLYNACYSAEDEPVIPNLEVIPSVIDKVNNIDPQLIATLRLIKKVQKEKVGGK